MAEVVEPPDGILKVGILKDGAVEEPMGLATISANATPAAPKNPCRRQDKTNRDEGKERVERVCIQKGATEGDEARALWRSLPRHGH